MSLRVRLLFNFPTYKVLAVSIVSVIVGLASISLSVIGLINQIWGHYVATGVWSGSVIAVTGFFGIASAQTRGVCVVKTFMMFAIFSFVSCGVIALSIGGLVYNSRFYSEVLPHHPNTRLIHGMLLGTGTLQTLLSLLCAIICIKHICCRPKPKIPPTPADREEIRPPFRRGNGRESQLSTAPLVPSGSGRQNSPGSGAHKSSSSKSSRQHSDTSNRTSRSRDRKRSCDNRQERKSSERSTVERARQHSSNMHRNRHVTLGNRSPDRYANKPQRSEVPNEELTERASNGSTNIGQTMLAIESHPDTAQYCVELINDMDRSAPPPYAEIIQDDELDDSVFPLSTTASNFLDVESVSMTSYDSLLGKPNFDKDCTRTKEIAAEQEALLCLSAAIESPVSNNMEIENSPLDSVLQVSNIDIVSENVRKLSTDLVISSLDDEQCAPVLSPEERHVLLQKYRCSDPDPQGVLYKEFSRKSDVIKDCINDGKPKRSKSFQQTRERQFARGKSLSSRHLSFDTENPYEKKIKGDEIIPTKSEFAFRPASKSFSRASSIPNKAPPKPPRTCSLKQNGNNKERPRSATLPFSQGAPLNILDDEKHDELQGFQKDNKNQLDDNKLFGIDEKIQPPKFRYPRPKLTSYTFQEYKKPLNSHEIVSRKDEETPILETMNPRSPSLPANETPKSKGPVTSRSSLTLPISADHSQTRNTNLESPLKSPTDYSLIPLKDILLKGQKKYKSGQNLEDLEHVSKTSDDASSEDSPSIKSTPNEEVRAEPLDGDANFSDTEGQPMYSFLL